MSLAVAAYYYRILCVASLEVVMRHDVEGYTGLLVAVIFCYWLYITSLVDCVVGCYIWLCGWMLSCF